MSTAHLDSGIYINKHSDIVYLVVHKYILACYKHGGWVLCSEDEIVVNAKVCLLLNGPELRDAFFKLAEQEKNAAKTHTI